MIDMHQKPTLLTIITLLTIGLCVNARANDADDLTESTGLPTSEQPATPTPTLQTSADRTRAYVLVDVHTHGKGGERSPWYSIIEGSATLDREFPEEHAQTFLDVRVYKDTERDASNFVLEQIGVRLHSTDSVVLALGRERNRRAPGLVVAPSDFIHSNEQLPGLRQERSGVWLVRASHQQQDETLDLMLLPISKVRDTGTPEGQQKFHGIAGRYSRQLGALEANLNLGSLDETLRLGASIQTIVADVFKVYGEWGMRSSRTFLNHERKNPSDYLLGLDYAGVRDLSVRGELYLHGGGLSADEWAGLRRARENAQRRGITLALDATEAQSPFVRKLYGIASATYSDILERFTVTDTLIKSLEDASYLNLTRVDWPVDAHQEIGTTLLHISRKDSAQYFARPFDWQITCDWQFSF